MHFRYRFRNNHFNQQKQVEKKQNVPVLFIVSFAPPKYQLKSNYFNLKLAASYITYIVPTIDVYHLSHHLRAERGREPCKIHNIQHTHVSFLQSQRHI